MAASPVGVDRLFALRPGHPTDGVGVRAGHVRGSTCSWLPYVAIGPARAAGHRSGGRRRAAGSGSAPHTPCAAMDCVVSARLWAWVTLGHVGTRSERMSACGTRALNTFPLRCRRVSHVGICALDRRLLGSRRASGQAPRNGSPYRLRCRGIYRGSVDCSCDKCWTTSPAEGRISATPKPC
jgi:hypothetical protein